MPKKKSTKKQYCNSKYTDREYWKAVAGYDPAYQLKVSTTGRVCLIPETKLDTTGREYVHICGRDIPVDVLVAQAFIPNRTNSEVPIHIDGNMSNSRVSNLRWEPHTKDPLLPGRIYDSISMIEYILHPNILTERDKEFTKFYAYIDYLWKSGQLPKEEEQLIMDGYDKHRKRVVEDYMNRQQIIIDSADESDIRSMQENRDFTPVLQDTEPESQNRREQEPTPDPYNSNPASSPEKIHKTDLKAHNGGEITHDRVSHQNTRTPDVPHMASRPDTSYLHDEHFKVVEVEEIYPMGISPDQQKTGVHNSDMGPGSVNEYPETHNTEKPECGQYDESSKEMSSHTDEATGLTGATSTSTGETGNHNEELTAGFSHTDREDSKRIKPESYTANPSAATSTFTASSYNESTDKFGSFNSSYIGDKMKYDGELVLPPPFEDVPEWVMAEALVDLYERSMNTAFSDDGKRKQPWVKNHKGKEVLPKLIVDAMNRVLNIGEGGIKQVPHGKVNSYVQLKSPDTGYVYAYSKMPHICLLKESLTGKHRLNMLPQLPKIEKEKVIEPTEHIQSLILQMREGHLPEWTKETVLDMLMKWLDMKDNPVEVEIPLERQPRKREKWTIRKEVDIQDNRGYYDKVRNGEYDYDYENGVKDDLDDRRDSGGPVDPVGPEADSDSSGDIVKSILDKESHGKKPRIGKKLDFRPEGMFEDGILYDANYGSTTSDETFMDPENEIIMDPEKGVMSSSDSNYGSIKNKEHGFIPDFTESTGLDDDEDNDESGEAGYEDDELSDDMMGFLNESGDLVDDSDSDEDGNVGVDGKTGNTNNHSVTFTFGSNEGDEDETEEHDEDETGYEYDEPGVESDYDESGNETRSEGQDAAVSVSYDLNEYDEYGVLYSGRNYGDSYDDLYGDAVITGVKKMTSHTEMEDELPGITGSSGGFDDGMDPDYMYETGRGRIDDGYEEPRSDNMNSERDSILEAGNVDMRNIISVMEKSGMKYDDLVTVDENKVTFDEETGMYRFDRPVDNHSEKPDDMEPYHFMPYPESYGKAGVDKDYESGYVRDVVYKSEYLGKEIKTRVRIDEMGYVVHPRRKKIWGDKERRLMMMPAHINTIPEFDEYGRPLFDSSGLELKWNDKLAIPLNRCTTKGTRGGYIPNKERDWIVENVLEYAQKEIKRRTGECDVSPLYDPEKDVTLGKVNRNAGLEESSYYNQHGQKVYHNVRYGEVYDPLRHTLYIPELYTFPDLCSKSLMDDIYLKSYMDYLAKWHPEIGNPDVFRLYYETACSAKALQQNVVPKCEALTLYTKIGRGKSVRCWLPNGEIMVFQSIKMAADATGCSVDEIKRCCNGDVAQVRRIRWEYVDIADMDVMINRYIENVIKEAEEQFGSDIDWSQYIKDSTLKRKENVLRKDRMDAAKNWIRAGKSMRKNKEFYKTWVGEEAEWEGRYVNPTTYAFQNSEEEFDNIRDIGQAYDKSIDELDEGKQDSVIEKTVRNDVEKVELKSMIDDMLCDGIE